MCGGSTGCATTGRITALNLVPAPSPEPSTLALFAVVGAVALVRHPRLQLRWMD